MLQFLVCYLPIVQTAVFLLGENTSGRLMVSDDLTLNFVGFKVLSHSRIYFYHTKGYMVKCECFDLDRHWVICMPYVSWELGAYSLAFQRSDFFTK